MTKIPPDDILEGLYKFRIRESGKLKTVLELYNMEIHQKKAGPDYHRLTAMVKRSIEQNLRIENFEARSGNYERNAAVKNQRTKQCGQRILGDCWQWKANGQCSKVDSCSFRHDLSRILHQVLSCGRMREMRREPEVPEARVAAVECLDGLVRITLKELAPIHSVKSGILQYACSTRQRVDADLVEKCSYAHRQVEEQPSKRSKKNGDKSAVAMLKKNEQHHRTVRPVVYAYSSNTRQLGCVFQDLEPPKSSSILRKSSDLRKPIRCVKFTKAVARHLVIQDQNPSFGMICPGELHQRNPNAPKFEDRSQEETEWQEQGAREASWKLAKSVLKI